jgi:GGDEF domain-containing protein
LERQRFVYFFNDQLTRAYNINYLELILSTGPMPEHRFASVLLLHDFSRFNAQQGWAQGDLLLQDLAIWLEQQCPDALVFRVHGDDFVILSEQVTTLNSEQLTHSPLGRTGLRYELKHFDLHVQGCDALRNILGMSSLLQEAGK